MFEFPSCMTAIKSTPRTSHRDEFHPPTRMTCSARRHGCTAENSKKPSQTGNTVGRVKHRCTTDPPEYLRWFRDRNAAAPPTASAACHRTPPSPHTTGARSGSSAEWSFAEQEFPLTDFT
ncbi:hypothetical protein PIB30_070486 [Stylosanthes scabra]|uniref:Uncharacterized protein n=1 Tax=Stylosanthes scabra TaxID=79078 RepID=A0ABU6ZMB4_9FABA|nr:hypothetical protein [Stylosanthes scabra]